ncbi:MAG: hypothetical protein ACPGD8_07695, partial [Flavobacteriales bacterium]
KNLDIQNNILSNSIEHNFNYKKQLDSEFILISKALENIKTDEGKKWSQYWGNGIFWRSTEGDH